MKYLTSFLLLTVAFALTTAGLTLWHAQDFGFQGIWFFDNDYKLHPIHFLVLGIAMIPPALWEIFMLDQKHDDEHKR